MSDKGIIFSAPMVRALLEGRKTQTRRRIRPELVAGARFDGMDHDGRMLFVKGCSYAKIKPPYAPGDCLYVRESWSLRGRYSDVVEVGYRASAQCSYTEFVEQWPVESAIPGKGQWPDWPKYGPSIHMPRWASRLWLAVTDVRVQRLLDISAEDSMAEGIDDLATAHFGTPIEAYAGLWNSLHGVEGSTWADNPWVVAVSFDVHRGNIDQGIPV